LSSVPCRLTNRKLGPIGVRDGTQPCDAADDGDVSVNDDAKSMQVEAAKASSSGGHDFLGRRRLVVGTLGVLALAAALWFGIPWIRFALSTVSTDDAFVNGRATFVAPRVHGQVSRVLVDDNNRVRKGNLLVQLDKEPFRDARRNGMRSCDFVALRYCQFAGLDQITMTVADPGDPVKGRYGGAAARGGATRT
jgi:hypothetical protein